MRCSMGRSRLFSIRENRMHAQKALLLLLLGGLSNTASFTQER